LPVTAKVNDLLEAKSHDSEKNLLDVRDNLYELFFSSSNDRQVESACSLFIFCALLSG